MSRRNHHNDCDGGPVHDHGGNNINNNDQHDDQPVTVSDLLDAFYAWVNNDDSTERNEHYHAVRVKASEDVLRSFYDLTYAISRKRESDDAIADLTPEERAEYDRRTT